jgi:phage gp16-like protein
MLSNKQKAVIHLARQRTGMSDLEYRDLLSGFGASSCTELTQRQFDQILRHFIKLGFKSSRSKAAAQGKSRLLAKIAAMRKDLGLPVEYIDAMAQRMFKVDSVRWLSADQLRRLAAALTYHRKRQTT